MLLPGSSLFLQQYSGHIARGCPCHGPAHIGGLARRIVHVAVVRTHTAGLYHPVRHGGDTEVPDQPYEHEHQIDGRRSIRGEDAQGIPDHFHLALQHQRLYPGEHHPEQVGDGQPEIYADITGQPLDERVLETVEDRYRESEGAQHGEDDEKEGADRVHHQRSGTEKELHHLAHDGLHDALQGERIAGVGHPLHHRVVLLIPAHVGDLLFQLLVRGVELPGHGHLQGHLGEQPVLFLLELPHVEGLVVEHGTRSLNDGAQDTVQASQHDHVEEQDADAQAEGTQHAEHVHRLGTREGLPHAVGYVEESPCRRRRTSGWG